MTDQRTERKIDFFDLEVALKPDSHTGDFDLDPVFVRAQIEPHTIEQLEDCRLDMQKRIHKAVRQLYQELEERGLMNVVQPVIYSTPNWDTGIADFQITVEARPEITINPDVVKNDYSSEFYLALRKMIALCTPSRHPITGGE